MFNSVRVRLTLWYTLAFGLLLIGFSLFVYSVMSRNLHARLDRSLLNAAHTTAKVFQSEVDENAGNQDAGASEALRELRMPDLYIAFYRGNHLLASDHPECQRLAISELVSTIPSGSSDTVFKTVSEFGSEGARLAVMSLRAANDDFNGDYHIVILEPLDDLSEQLEAIRRIFYFGLPVTLLASGAGGLLLARKSLAPVAAMTNQAERISAKNLHERLSINNAHDELGRLATVFNELLSRLDHSFEDMRIFIANASHELRTPLSIIRGEADVALSQDRQRSEYKETLTIIQDESRRLSRLVDDMLELARADAGQRRLQVEEFYLNDLLEECCRAAQVLAAQKKVRLEMSPHPDTAFRGNEDLLRRMVMNLLDNAIKYTPANGSVLVKMTEAESSVEIIVSDTGIGIPAKDAPRIFERFYRISKARSRADGGTGLGLSIVRWAVEAHNGSIKFSSFPDQGSTFVVTLPR